MPLSPATRPAAARSTRGRSGGSNKDADRNKAVREWAQSSGFKYTGADGRVEVRVWHADGGAGLTVTDSGPGIAAEDLPRVFDRFSRLDPARSRACGGSGLGLAICKALVEAHGGRIWANSTPGTGSSFVLTLPTEPPVGPPAARIAPEPSR